MIKILSLSFLFFSIATNANTSLEELFNCARVGSLTVPNCSRQTFIEDSEVGNFEELCRCKTEFESFAGRFPGLNIQVQPNLKSTLLNELKKTVAANLLDVTTLRSVYNINANVDDVSRKCDLNQLSNSEELGCLAGNEFESLRGELSRELANMVSTNPPLDDKGILKRSSSAYTNSCNIPDQVLSKVEVLGFEEALINDTTSPSFIDQVLTLNPLNQESLSTLIDQSELKYRFYNHPILNSMLNPASNLKQFFSSLSTPRTINSLRENLYNNPANSQRLIAEIGERCQRAFQTIKQNLCKPAILNNRVRVRNFSLPNPFTKLNDSVAGQFLNMPEPVSDANMNVFIQKMQDNADLVKVCQIRDEAPSSRAPVLDDILESISGWLPKPDEASVNLESFGRNRYQRQLGNSRVKICRLIESPPTCQPSSTSEDCDLWRRYQATITETANTPASVATSGGTNYNALLRSMIGSPSIAQLGGANNRDAQILIAAGIIPQANGELVAQRETASTSSYRPGASTPADLAQTRTTVSSGNQRASATRSQPQSRTRADSSTTIAADTTQYGAADQTAVTDLGSDTRDLTSEYADRMRQQGQTDRRAVAGNGRTAVRRPVSTTPQPQSVSAIQPAGYVQPQAPTEQNPTGLMGGSSGQTARPLENVVPFNEQVRRAQALAARMGMAGAGGGGGSAAQGLAAGGAAEVVRGPASADALVALEVAADASNVTQVLTEKIRSDDQLQRFISGEQGFTLRLNNRLVQINYIDGVFVVANKAGFPDTAIRNIETILNDRSLRRPAGDPVRLREVNRLLQTRT